MRVIDLQRQLRDMDPNMAVYTREARGHLVSLRQIDVVIMNPDADVKSHEHAVVLKVASNF